MVINSFISEKNLNEETFSKKTEIEFIKEIRNIRFHIHLFGEKTENSVVTDTNSLRCWLKAEFNISDNPVINFYESLVLKWLSATQQKNKLKS